MNFSCKHAVLRVTDTQRSRSFYHEKLGLELLEDYPQFFVLRAGSLRISVFGGFESTELKSEETIGFSLVLSTDDIVAAKTLLEQRGCTAEEDIIEAPGFMKFFPLKDPDGNLLHIAQYLREDLLAKVDGM